MGNAIAKGKPSGWAVLVARAQLGFDLEVALTTDEQDRVTKVARVRRRSAKRRFRLVGDTLGAWCCGRCRV